MLARMALTRLASLVKHARGLSRVVAPQEAEAFAHCAAQVRQHDYTSFLCTVALPPAHRAAAFAVRAFNVETAQARDRSC